jgi:DHA1 family multidrug resistance protein-like MFS transporter
VADAPAAPSYRLSDAAAKRGLLVLLISTFFAWGGFFLVIPMISVHYVDQLGWSAASIGLVLAARQFLQQGLTPFSGALADRYGAKPLIVLGMAVRTVGFAGMAFAATYPILMTTAIVSAIGGALFESPRAAAIAALAREDERAAYYAKTGVMGGLGITFGTQVGALLLGFDFRYVALAAAGSYIILLILIVVWLPAVKVAEEGGALQGLSLAFRDRYFLRYLTFSSGQQFMSAQFSITLPLVAVAVAGNAGAVAWVYAVNSLVAVVLGYPIPRLAERHLGARLSLVVGVLITAIGLFMIGLSRETISLLVAVFVYSVGVVLVRPIEQTVVASLANPVALGSYFGVASLAVAFGGGLGNFAGGALYDVGDRLHQPALPWFIFGAIGLVAALGIWWNLVGPAKEAPRRQIG